MKNIEFSTIFQVFRSWKSGLGVKFSLLVAVILLVTLGVTATINHRSQNALFLEHLRAKGEVLGQFVASVSPQAILAYDFITLNEYVREIAHQEDVVYAVIVTPDNANLTTYLDHRNSYIADAIQTVGQNDILKVIDYVSTNRDVINMRFPIIFDDNNLGTVLIGISRVRIEHLSRNELIKGLLGNALIILFLILCIYFIFRVNTLRPIHQLIRGSNRIARGDLDLKVPVYHNDELGVLAHTFNDMINNLKTSTAEKDSALDKVHELNRTLETRIKERTHDLEAANKELKYMALYDSMTDLPNRSLLQDRLRQAIKTAEKLGEPLTVMMMDLDRFKEVNDTLGHDVGDKLLKDVGNRIKHALRYVGTIGRFGGDEFAIIVPRTDSQDSIILTNKLLHALEAPFVVEDLTFSIGASIGIAIYPKHGTDTLTLLKRADVAMYVAKHNKSGHFIYDISEDRHSTHRLALMEQLRNAINSGELQLYYQPIIDLTDGKIICAEALVRWPHAERGFIMPNDFIPLMEQTGLIKPFTYWVLDTAMRQRKEWNRIGIDISVAVNLSMRNLQDPEFPNRLANLLQRWEITPGALILEITESAVMAETQYASQIYTHFEAMGMLLAIDDFGTGYSSLDRLKKLPVSEIKIDKSFVIGMATSKDDTIIVRSTIDLAHNLGLKVIAEGVENQKTMDSLAALDCDMAQGFHIAQPMPPDEFVQFVRDREWKAKYGRIRRQAT